MVPASVEPSAAARDPRISALVASPVLSATGMQVGGRGALPGLTLDFVLRPGELELIESRYKERSSDIADDLLGLAPAGSGSVRFLGRAWSELARREAFELRREVGRVQARGNWMEARSVLDNVLTPARHHTILPEHALRERASALAQQFGLPGLPLLLPDGCASDDLERAACVRAFLGRPALVILEHPMAYEDSGLLTPLMNAIQQVRRRGGAVIWFTEHASHVREASLSADRQRELVDTHLIDVTSNGR
jgi:phospholipid/cholesterol/gamma-HCH transport system ATP-binding protein